MTGASEFLQGFSSGLGLMLHVFGWFVGLLAGVAFLSVVVFVFDAVVLDGSKRASQALHTRMSAWHARRARGDR